MLDTGVLPIRSSSRIRSPISTLPSIAMPSVSTIPAIPGMVSVALTIDRTAASRVRLVNSAMTAIRPNSR